MNEAFMLVFVAVAGMTLGVVFFGGLWWTVRRGLSSPSPALWFLGSLLLRTGVVVTGFYFVSAGRWQRLLLCLLGFVVARVVLTRLLGGAREASHAP